MPYLPAHLTWPPAQPADAAVPGQLMMSTLRIRNELHDSAALDERPTSLRQNGNWQVLPAEPPCGDVRAALIA